MEPWLEAAFSGQEDERRPYRGCRRHCEETVEERPGMGVGMSFRLRAAG